MHNNILIKQLLIMYLREHTVAIVWLDTIHQQSIVNHNNQQSIVNIYFFQSACRREKFNECCSTAQ